MKNYYKALSIAVFLLGMMPTLIFSQNAFTLKSKDLAGNATQLQEFNGFGCSGENNSPQLSWENAPEGTKSFAVTMYDPDAPTGSGWWHWLIFDIDAKVNELKANAGNIKLKLHPKKSIQSINDYSFNGYGGPCPPKGHGFHQYVITVYALKVDTLGLKENTNPAVVGYYLNSNTIGKASLVSYYSK